MTETSAFIIIDNIYPFKILDNINICIDKVPPYIELNKLSNEKRIDCMLLISNIIGHTSKYELQNGYNKIELLPINNDLKLNFEITKTYKGLTETIWHCPQPIEIDLPDTETKNE